MLINLSNHPSSLWGQLQTIEAVTSFGSITDMPFPAVAPEADTIEILELANKVGTDCIEMIKMSANSPSAVHIMGELTLCFAVVAMLQREGITCIASTSVRNAEVENGVKSSVFNFYRFREYPNLYHGNQGAF
jgi:hypothetical protein